MPDSTVKAESPGLWMMNPEGEAYTDKELVEQAEIHLRKLLTNPYYHEAYQRLRRKKEPSLSPLTSLHVHKGALAAKIQRPTTRKKGPGRKRKHDPLCELLLTLSSKNPERSLAEQCRIWVSTFPDAIKSKWPHIRQEKVLAEKLAQHLRNYRRKHQPNQN